MRSTKACTSNVVGALLRLRLVTASRQGIVKGEGSSFASLARNCKQTVIQASSPLTKKQNFKFIKTIFANFKIPFTRKNWLLKFGFAYRLAQILEPKLLAHEILKFAGVSIKRKQCKAPLNILSCSYQIFKHILNQISLL